MQLSVKEAQKQLQSLVESKLILMSESSSGDSAEIDQSSAFKLNTNFVSKRTKFRITAAVSKETPQVRTSVGRKLGKEKEKKKEK